MTPMTPIEEHAHLTVELQWLMDSVKLNSLCQRRTLAMLKVLMKEFPDHVPYDKFDDPQQVRCCGDHTMNRVPAWINCPWVIQAKAAVETK